MADNVKTETTTTEVSVTDADLAKSIEELKSLLDSDETEGVEKAVIGTDGGLQAETPSDGTINKDIQEDEQELSKSPLEAAEAEASAPINITKGLETEEEGEVDEEFAKSLAAAFSAQETLMEQARENEFAKSLVLSTIEGFSIQNEEINKALSGFEERQNEKLERLVKALVPLMQVVEDIRKEVKDVSNAPVRSVPKAAGVIEKSFTTDTGKATLTKAQIGSALERMAIAKKIQPQVVAAFESTGYIDPALLAEIQNGSAR